MTGVIISDENVKETRDILSKQMNIEPEKVSRLLTELFFLSKIYTKELRKLIKNQLFINDSTLIAPVKAQAMIGVLLSESIILMKTLGRLGNMNNAEQKEMMIELVHKNFNQFDNVNLEDKVKK